ncbi:M12 family metallopeptidase [Streptomyces sp. ISL-98]|uniref:Dot/Icm T4SS effector Zinc-dependent metalloprotease LegP n=1 Tax=Streptomyces sp. ISL-98 TaxID=2819192 RepID=UPI001BE9A905|nr:Dot/Icm T4SS effector Zinc-dependent metalloprotease LegP [Streptomyces sp. ISL-98]MBT2510766.1 M12 family metallopeptidase [Streptomyces sp. ISL-98]
MNASPSDPTRRTKKTAARKSSAAKKTTPARKQATARKATSSRKANGSGEYRSGPVVGTALVDGATFRAKGLQYAEVDGMAMFEGDIVLGTVQEMEELAAQGPVLESIGIPAVEAGQQRRWPNATVPFEIDPALPNQQRVRDAIAHWESRTRIRFAERTSANAAQFPDFVRFVPGDGCSSNIGRRGGRQTITLGPNCTTGNTIHEIGHTVGLWHEQSREDRDRFVAIVFTNVDPDMQHNFLQHIADGDDLGPYDYGSIMHYPPGAFAIDTTRPTIIPRNPLPPGVVMGQRTELSQGDIDGVHMMYPVTSPTLKEIPKDPIHEPVFTLKELAKDPIHDVPAKLPGLDLQSQPTVSPFVLATPHQSPAMAGPSDGLAEQVRQLSQMIGTLQQGLSAVVASHNSLLTQIGSALPGGAGQPR